MVFIGKTSHVVNPVTAFYRIHRNGYDVGSTTRSILSETIS